MRIPFALAALVFLLACPMFAEGPQSAVTPQVRPLASDEFTRYMKALDQVMSIRSNAEQEFRADPAKGADASVAAAYMKQAQTAMQSNGFTNESFNTVHWNVMQAFAQLEIQANAEDVRETIEQQREELAEAKGKMPEEQFAVVTKRLEHTEAMLNGFGGVPDENIELVRKNMASLKATFERGMGGAKAGYTQSPKAKQAQ